jgi:alkanesulfonate monooxygenase SsuD/methylene tetrahydromethanopterin reductase-like flavin-dependent oxidoreductase (luciferase family)
VSQVRIGALCWNQYADWPSLREAGLRADRLGYDSLWTWDHVYPIVGSADGPMFEAYATIAAWAAMTERVRIGVLVAANPYREPALTAKMITTIDHISDGRAILGIGSAWFQPEADAFGIPFGAGAPERLRWLGEALPLMRGMLDGTRPSATGPRYAADAVVNEPLPIQPHLPILVGGGGERVTLRLVAKYADANNVGGGIANVRRKEAVLLEHCAAIGRDPAEIERTTSVGTVLIRDAREEVERLRKATFARNGGAEPWANQPSGTPEDVAEHLAPYVELGYRHLIAGHPAPYDEESMTRLVTEVKPMLERI